MSNNNFDLTNEEIFKLGVLSGRQQLADHIQNQFKIGKPLEINGHLYWLKDERQNLQDIMEDIESVFNEEHGLNKFIVPDTMTVREFADKMSVRPSEIIKWLFMHGKIVNGFDSEIGFDDMKGFAGMYGYFCEKE